MLLNCINDAYPTILVGIESKTFDYLANIDLNFSATRYHSLIIENKTLNNEFEIIAENKNKIIMGIAHKKLPIYGLQFHPESIGTKNGKTILNNFLKLIKYEY